MIPSTSTDVKLDESVHGLSILSDYEDAVSSEEELNQLCHTLKTHIGQTSRQRHERKLERRTHNKEKLAKYRNTSSSEHSSIEKLQPGEFRSRRNTGYSRRKTLNGAHSDSDQSGDWRLLNLAFQEMAHYPLLVQLNEQLVEISRQLNEVETTNGLQLRIIMHLLHRVSKPRNTWLKTIWRFAKSFQFFIFAFTWPFIVRIIYYWYIRMIRRRIAF